MKNSEKVPMQKRRAMGSKETGKTRPSGRPNGSKSKSKEDCK